jgi:hypothetical protein
VCGLPVPRRQQFGRRATDAGPVVDNRLPAKK